MSDADSKERPTPPAGTFSVLPSALSKEEQILTALREVREQLRQTREEIRTRVFNVETSHDDTRRELRRLERRVDDLEAEQRKLVEELRIFRQQNERHHHEQHQTFEAMKRHVEETTRANTEALATVTKSVSDLKTETKEHLRRQDGVLETQNTTLADLKGTSDIIKKAVTGWAASPWFKGAVALGLFVGGLLYAWYTKGQPPQLPPAH